MAHSRLSIIDFSKKLLNQCSLRGRLQSLIMVNFIAGGWEGSKRRVIFKSQSDTEVVLYSYVKWKEKCLLKFNGMFAFGIWDLDKESLFVARDGYIINLFITA